MSDSNHLFACFCETKCKSPEELSRHIYQTHKNRVKPVTCSCGKKFINNFFYAQHLNSVHGNDLRRKLHPCHFCAKVFASLQYLKQHQRSQHHKSCKVCHKTFKSVEVLNHHISRLHSTLKIGHRCSTCRKRFVTAQYLQDHIERFHHPKTFYKYRQTVFCCKYCGKFFQANKFLDIHVNLNHQCQICGDTFTYKATRDRHVKSHPKIRQKGSGISLPPLVHFKEIQAFQGYLSTYRYAVTNTEAIDSEFYSVHSIFQHCHAELAKIFLNSLQKFNAINIQLSVCVRFQRRCDDNHFEYKQLYMNGYRKLLYAGNYSDQLISELEFDLTDKVEKFERYGSGWTVSLIIGLDCRINKTRSPTGSCYIKMPMKIITSHAVVNVRNNDNRCFKWAVLSVLHPTNSHSERVSSYEKFQDQYVWNPKWFPMKFENIVEFEKINNVAVNVFGYDFFDGIIPLRISTFNYSSNFVTANLLQVKRSPTSFHFGGIKDLGKLLGKRNLHAKDYCFNCNNLVFKAKLQDHFEQCIKNNCAKCIMPKVDERTDSPPKLKFKDYNKKLKAGFVMYCDIESILKPIKKKCRNHNFYRRHIPSGISYVVVKDNGEVVWEYLYRGEDCIERFFEELDYWGKFIEDVFKENVSPIITPNDQEQFELATHCHICNKELLGDKCWDHCHRTGVFRAAAHKNCNLNYVQQQKIPIIMHNFRGYDSHFIIEGFRKYDQEKQEIFVIPTNTERYLSIVCKNFYFIDSLQFLNASLAELVENLLKSCSSESDKKKKFDIMYTLLQHNFPFADNVDPLLNLMVRKGIYCYDYIKSWKTFEEKKLPSKKHFYNTLRETGISDDDYEHAKMVFEKFECKNLGDFHDIYLKSDVAQLAAVFESFRSFSLENYKLDPCHYFSIPGLAWDALLLMSDIELDLLTDINQYMFMETGIRGGVSMISQRYSKANNRYCRQYKPEMKQKSILFLDCNNLYGKAMMEALPVSNFEWENDPNSFDIWSLTDDGDTGAIIECDLSYPQELHDKHNSYPLAPEHVTVEYSQLSNFQKNLYDSIYGVDGGKSFNNKTKKLIPHLGPRKNYITHYRNLKFYLEHGLVLDKIHKVLTFNQKAWMKDFIILNTNKRINATNSFDQDLFKLIINSSFGKGCENVRKHLTVKIVNNCKKAVMYASKPNLKKWEIIRKDLAVFALGKKRLLLAKPLYTGFSVLEISKLIMYQFHYQFCEIFKDKVQLLFTDTDSLCYEIESQDIYKDLAPLSNGFDFSNYKKNHFLFSEANKKIPGKMKDEFKGEIITEVVGLCSKMYSVIGDNNIKKQACKGTAKYVVNTTLHHSLYKKYLHNQQSKVISQNSIISRAHKVYSVKMSKKSIHSFDTKRYIHNDGIHTYAWNHYRTYE